DGAANGRITDPGGPAFVVPPTVESVVINDGHPQRSKVNRITITFSTEVTLDPGAVGVRNAAGKSVRLRVSTSVVNGRTVAVLTFKGRGIVGGSLADGRYTLRLHSSRLRNRFGTALDGDRDGRPGGDAVRRVVRRFGDTDGDGDVDQADLRVFRATL